MGRRMQRSTRIEASSPDVMDLDSLEAFCRSARANGASGLAPVSARVAVRGGVRRLWVDIAGESEPAGFHDPRVRMLDGARGPSQGPQRRP